MSKKTVLEFEATTTTNYKLVLDKEYSDEDLEFLEELERRVQPDNIGDYIGELKDHHIKVVEQIGDPRDPDDWEIEWTDTYDHDFKDEEK